MKEMTDKKAIFKNLPFSFWLRMLFILGLTGVLLLICANFSEEKPQPRTSDSQVLPVNASPTAAYLVSAGKENSSPAASPAARTEAGETSVALNEKVLEERVQAALEQVAGVGKVTVAISLTAGPRKEYAVNTSKDAREISEKDERGGTRVTSERNESGQVVLLSGSQGAGSPVVVREMGPEIKGVLVIAEGASDARVREELMRAVQTVLAVPAYRIQVLPRSLLIPAGGESRGETTKS